MVVARVSRRLCPCCLLAVFFTIFFSRPLLPFSSLSLSGNNTRENDQKWPASVLFRCNLFLLLMHRDIIKSWSSFNIHLHNITSTLSVAALRGPRMCYRSSDYLPEDDAAEAGTYNYLFIMHPLKHKCTLLSHSASYFTHKPENGLGF